jgi:transcriptional regulator with XRE-family HTH domain
MNSQDRIRLARRHAGLSQARLAEAIGVQRSAVSHWESPQGKNPSVDHLRTMALVTGVTFEWLATGRGKMQLSEDAVLDSVSAADAILVEEPLELRLVQAFREASPKTRVAIVEIVEELAAKRLGRTRPKRPNSLTDPAP